MTDPLSTLRAFINHEFLTAEGVRPLSPEDALAALEQVETLVKAAQELNPCWDDEPHGGGFRISKGRGIAASSAARALRDALAPFSTEERR